MGVYADVSILRFPNPTYPCLDLLEKNQQCIQCLYSAVHLGGGGLSCVAADFSHLRGRWRQMGELEALSVEQLVKCRDTKQCISKH